MARTRHDQNRVWSIGNSSQPCRCRWLPDPAMAYGARQAFRERQAKVRRRFEQADTERGSARRVYCGSDRVLCPRLAGNSSGAGVLVDLMPSMTAWDFRPIAFAPTRSNY